MDASELFCNIDDFVKDIEYKNDPNEVHLLQSKKDSKKKWNYQKIDRPL